MIEKELLLNQLDKVKYRLEILDMIEEKLLQMRKLAQRVIDEELTDAKILKINNEVQNLEQQAKFLDTEAI